jgi:hypothetical protein
MFSVPVVIWGEVMGPGFSQGCGQQIPRRSAPRNDNEFGCWDDNEG